LTHTGDSNKGEIHMGVYPGEGFRGNSDGRFGNGIKKKEGDCTSETAVGHSS